MPTKSAGAPQKKRRRLRRSIVLLLLLITCILLAAPTIISRTPLHNTLLQLALPTDGWQVEAQQVALSWSGEQTFVGLSVVDSEGAPMLTAESITLRRSLLSLAWDWRALGQLKLTRPTLYLATRPEGSNVEDFLGTQRQTPQSELSSTDSLSDEGAIALEIEVVGGSVHGFDSASQQRWSLDETDLQATVEGDTVTARGSAALRAEGQPVPGRMNFRLQPTAEGGQQLEILVEQLPLSSVEPWLARALPGGRIAGTASADIEVRWKSDPQRGLVLQTTGRVEANRLGLTADMLAGDVLRCDRLVAPWKLSVVGDQMTIENFSVDAGWAKLQAVGTASLTEWASVDLTNLPRREASVSGRIALDQLAAMLPRTMQLRPGVRIDEGQMEFQIAARPTGKNFTWTATATVQNVAGTDGRRAIRWQQPVEASARWIDASAGPRLEQLSLVAPFADAKFATAGDKITGDFRFNLEDLARELGQFVDLQSWQLRGRGEGNLAINRGASGQFQATGAIGLSNLDIAKDQRSWWNESRLDIELSATGREDQWKPVSLTDASIQLRGQRDTLDLTLLQPMDLAQAELSSTVKVSGRGPLQIWVDRLRPWLSDVPKELAGEAQIQATINITSKFVQVTESQVSIEQLRLRSDAIAVDEPRLQFAGDGRWDIVTGRFATRELQLIGSTVALRSRDVSLGFDSNGAPTATGQIAFRADLERLAGAFKLVGQQDVIWPRGTVEGQLQLATNAQEAEADFSATVKSLQLVRTGAIAGRPDLVWSEPQLQVTGKTVYDLSADRVQLDNFQLTGNTLRLNGSASLDKPRDTGLLQANGAIEYNSEQLATLLAGYLGPDIRFAGDQQVQFQLAGRLFDVQSGAVPAHWSQRWNLTAEAGWSAASLYGLPVGGSRFTGTLRDGQLQFTPLDVAVGQGRLTASPRATLSPGPEQLFLPKGPLLKKVAVSPQVSEVMLKYIAPVLAGATRAKGEFSIDLDGTEIPFADPSQTRVAGRLTVHRLSVAPGPMIADVAQIVAQVKALVEKKPFAQVATSRRSAKAITIAERQIDFQIAEGRVYHRNLEFLIDGVPVRSHGSVGFDQTLALVFEIPVQEKWIEREKLLRSLAGKTLEIQITGTFQKPRIDQRSIAQLSQQLLQGAASNAIGDEINRQLNKLLRGR